MAQKATLGPPQSFLGLYPIHNHTGTDEKRFLPAGEQRPGPVASTSSRDPQETLTITAVPAVSQSSQLSLLRQK
ncbi:unnamed protein product [Pleuronectes platessa]|uniref:Uncharacterized protein n=1 Tax=Pleuronectes platessa TaxID=8262 RepID=A0A9N7YJH8_PLEPL|nr:unnamed protein product [Pleuronectes platessa]